MKSVTFDKIDVDNLPTFDIEYIFLQVRSKSVGEVAKSLKLYVQTIKKLMADVGIDLLKLMFKLMTHTQTI